MPARIFPAWRAASTLFPCRNKHLVSRFRSRDWSLLAAFRVLVPDLARARGPCPSPIPLSAPSLDSSGLAATHRAGPSPRDPALTGARIGATTSHLAPTPSVARQHVARRTGLVAELPFFNRTQFLYQFTNGLTSIRGHSNRSDFSVLLRNRDRHRHFMNIEPTNFILFTDTSFRLWLCVLLLPTHSVNHALRIGAGRSMVTIRSRGHTFAVRSRRDYPANCDSRPCG